MDRKLEIANKYKVVNSLAIINLEDGEKQEVSTCFCESK